MSPNPFTILLVAATAAELNPLRSRLEEQTQHFGHDAGIVFRYLATGVGGVATAAALTEELITHPCDLVLNVGLAGALCADLDLGTVVMIASEQFGDLGAEARDGRHLSLFDLGLASPNEPPYFQGRLHPLPLMGDVGEASLMPGRRIMELMLAERFGESLTRRGTTVAQAHGSRDRIARFRETSDAEVESMEGAAVVWVAFRQNVPSVQIRAISNRVEPRDRDAWEIGRAMDALTASVLSLLVDLRERIRAAPHAPPPPSL